LQDKLLAITALCNKENYKKVFLNTTKLILMKAHPRERVQDFGKKWGTVLPPLRENMNFGKMYKTTC